MKINPISFLSDFKHCVRIEQRVICILVVSSRKWEKKVGFQSRITLSSPLSKNLL